MIDYERQQRAYEELRKLAMQFDVSVVAAAQVVAPVSAFTREELVEILTRHEPAPGIQILKERS